MSAVDMDTKVDSVAADDEMMLDDEELLRMASETLPDDAEATEDAPVEETKSSDLNIQGDDFSESGKPVKKSTNNGKNAAKTVQHKDADNISLSSHSGNFGKAVLITAAVSVAVNSSVRRKKLDSLRKKTEALNSKKTSRSNSSSYRSASDIMLELKIQEVKRKSEKLSKKEARVRSLGQKLAGMGMVLGRTAGRMGQAQVFASGSTSGAARSSVPTAANTAKTRVQSAESLNVEPDVSDNEREASPSL